jgi:hypothetical protein
MKKLLITLMLISPFSFADWGDTYYCQMTSFHYTPLDGKVREDRALEKFQFKLDKTEQSMIFGSFSWFKGLNEPLIDSLSMPAEEIWWAESHMEGSYFQKGKFIHSLVGVGGVTSISADCDKF